MWSISQYSVSSNTKGNIPGFLGDPQSSLRWVCGKVRLKCPFGKEDRKSPNGKISLEKSLLAHKVSYILLPQKDLTIIKSDPGFCFVFSFINFSCDNFLTFTFALILVCFVSTILEFKIVIVQFVTQTAYFWVTNTAFQVFMKYLAHLNLSNKFKSADLFIGENR